MMIVECDEARDEVIRNGEGLRMNTECNTYARECTIEETKRTCPNCQGNGKSSLLTFFWMGLNSGIWMCPSKECAFPLDSPTLSQFIENGLDINHSVGQKRKISPTDLENKKPIVSKDGCKRPRSSTEVNKTSLVNKCRTQKDCFSECSSHKLKPRWLTYPLWKNENSMCWLDVTLTILVTNATICNTVRKSQNFKSIIWNIIDLYSRIQAKFQETGSYNSVENSLLAVRKVAMNFLKFKLLVDSSGCDSPVFALPLLLKDESSELGFACTYNVLLDCGSCSAHQESRLERIIIPIPSPGTDFQFPENMVYNSNCNFCKNERKKSKVEIKSYAPVVMVQFPDGITRQVLEESLKRDNSNGFILTQIVQYTGSHFVCWSRHIKENKWLHADDLENPVVRYDNDKPDICPDEVFMMIWERLPRHRKASKPANLAKSKELLLTAHGSSENTQVQAMDIVKGFSPSVADMKSRQECKKTNIVSKTNTLRYQPYIARNKQQLTQNQNPCQQKGKVSLECNKDGKVMSTGASKTSPMIKPARETRSLSGSTVAEDMSLTDTRSPTSVSIGESGDGSSESRFGLGECHLSGPQPDAYDSAYSSPFSSTEGQTSLQSVLQGLSGPSSVSLANENDDSYGSFNDRLDYCDDWLFSGLQGTTNERERSALMFNLAFNLDMDDL